VDRGAVHLLRPGAAAAAWLQPARLSRAEAGDRAVLGLWLRRRGRRVDDRAAARRRARDGAAVERGRHCRWLPHLERGAGGELD